MRNISPEISPESESRGPNIAGRDRDAGYLPGVNISPGRFIRVAASRPGRAAAVAPRALGPRALSQARPLSLCLPLSLPLILPILPFSVSLSPPLTHSLIYSFTHSLSLTHTQTQTQRHRKGAAPLRRPQFALPCRLHPSLTHSYTHSLPCPTAFLRQQQCAAAAACCGSLLRQQQCAAQPGNRRPSIAPNAWLRPPTRTHRGDPQSDSDMGPVTRTRHGDPQSDSDNGDGDSDAPRRPADRLGQ